MAEKFTEGFFATSDGPRIQYREYACAIERGVPVLCLHGLTRNVRDFEELAPRIAGLGRRVIVASQRGRALSDRDSDVERYNPAVYTSDMLALLDDRGVERAVFIGTSMGGLMTMIAAATAPHRVAGAVLNDVGPEIDPEGLRRIRGFAGKARTATNWREAAELCREINGLAFPRETSDAFWVGFAKKLFREVAPGEIVFDYDPQIARTVREDSSALGDLWPLFDALKPVPTLLLRGEVSDVLMVSTRDEMRRRKPDLEVGAVPDVGHTPFMTEPAAWQALSGFLARTGLTPTA